ncbi:hypothetical protein E2C01_092938 [Portunus trituberculatus]|uniref:Uncharacterized protein n=1 Tax=Portunus trituberculatus TaxID=210409 RepID=A0A5B7JTK6_PORTR|nr:hypothetical protein [Portunus trituberculatus]
MLSTNLESQGTWSANRTREDKVVWIVLHRAFVAPCRKPRKGVHPLMFVVGPQTGPDCQMWLLLGLTSAEPGTSQDSRPSHSLIDHTSPPPSPVLWPRSPSPLPPPPASPPAPPPPTTVIASDVQTSTSKSASSALSKRPTSSIQDHSVTVTKGV